MFYIIQTLSEASERVNSALELGRLNDFGKGTSPFLASVSSSVKWGKSINLVSLTCGCNAILYVNGTAHARCIQEVLSVSLDLCIGLGVWHRKR